MGILEVRYILTKFILNFRVFKGPDTPENLAKKFKKMTLLLMTSDLPLGVEKR